MGGGVGGGGGGAPGRSWKMNSAAPLHSVMVSRAAVNGSERLRGSAPLRSFGAAAGMQTVPGGNRAPWREDLENRGNEMEGGVGNCRSRVCRIV